MAAEAAEQSWRRSVVQHLLLPVERIPAEAFGSQVIRQLPVERRAEAVYQVLSTQQFEDTEAGRELWALLCEQDRIERELREWGLLPPRTVTEKIASDENINALRRKLDELSRRLDEAYADERLRESVVSSPPTLDLRLLATPEQLVEAFGSRGLKLAWFKDLASRAWLKKARKVIGRGQRGHRTKPLFCPFEVMIGLANQSRKSHLSIDAGWRILEKRFPLVYDAKAIADPRGPTG